MPSPQTVAHEPGTMVLRFVGDSITQAINTRATSMKLTPKEQIVLDQLKGAGIDKYFMICSREGAKALLERQGHREEMPNYENILAQTAKTIANTEPNTRAHLGSITVANGKESPQPYSHYQLFVVKGAQQHMEFTIGRVRHGTHSFTGENRDNILDVLSDLNQARSEAHYPTSNHVISPGRISIPEPSTPGFRP